MLRQLIDLLIKVEEARVYGEEVKIHTDNPVRLTIVINEDSPDGGLTEELYNMSDEEVEEDWGVIHIGDIRVEWMTLPKEEF